MRVISKNILYPLFILVFIGGGYYSLSKSPEILKNLGFSIYFIISFFVAFFGIYINSRILKLLFSANLVALDSARSLKYSIFSSVAAIVPVVGASGMKFVLLKKNNVESKSSFRTLIVGASSYITSILIVASIGLFLVDKLYVLALSVVLLTLFFLLSQWAFRGISVAKSWGLIVLNLLLIAQESFRVWLCYMAIGYAELVANIMLLQASNIASLGGSAVPGGIGIKETGAALIAHSVDSDPAIAFIVFSLNRFLGYAALLPCFIWVLIYEKCHGDR